MPTQRPARNRVHRPAMPAARHVQGKVGSSSTYLSGPSCSLAGIVRFTTIHHDEEAAENHNRSRSTQTHEVRDHRSISPGLRVIVITVQEHLVDHRADTVARRLDQAKANV